MGRKIACRRPEVAPVLGIEDVAEESPLAVDDRREDIVLERTVLTLRNEIEDPRLQNVDPGVDRVDLFLGERLGRRFFKKPPDLTGLAGFHQTKLRRIINRNQ